jgi:hypothetical protein
MLPLEQRRLRKTDMRFGMWNVRSLYRVESLKTVTGDWQSISKTLAAVHESDGIVAVFPKVRYFPTTLLKCLRKFLSSSFLTKIRNITQIKFIL